MASKAIRFNLYRFQLLPTSKNIQKSFDRDIESVEDLRRAKNSIFGEVITSIKEFDYSYSELRHRVMLEDEEFVVIRLGVERDIDRVTEDFDRENVESWPFVHILINNNPTVQKIAVQRNRDAFSDTRTVTNILQDNINPLLRNYQLGFYIEPIFEKSEFWAVVDKYPDRITRVSFELISPNLANLSKALSEDLKDLATDTNTHKTNLDIKSNPESHLVLERDNEQLDSLAEYTSGGGGSVTFKVRGIKKKITTDESVSEITIDEIDLEASNEAQIAEAKDFIKGVVE